MCTMSAIRLSGSGFRVAFNRDELLSRDEALPPVRKTINGCAAVMPIDPESGGTWIAVNDAGVVYCLLNRNLDNVPPMPALRSRGMLIPQLADCGILSEALRRLEDIHPHDFGPFRLVAVSRDEIAEAIFDVRDLKLGLSQWNGEPILFTSSGLGDHIVQGARRRLFDCIMDGTPAAQDRFHRYSWPHARHLSICMARDDAQTVSHSAVTVDDLAATFRYHAGSPNRAGKTFEASIDRSGCLT